MRRWIEPVTLKGHNVMLEPLDVCHHEALQEALKDGELWRLWYTQIPTLDKVKDYIETALDWKERLGAMPFVVKENTHGNVIGCTRYFAVEADRKRLEIGYTWYSKRFQRTSINTECKLLLLTHAFETLETIAVEFRTSWFNHASRSAIARLGAKQDGILRNSMKFEDGSYRDTVVFSIIESEWLAVKQHLKFKLQEYSYS